MTFYLVEESGQIIFTPPMKLLHTLKVGYVYRSSFEEHADIFINNLKDEASYLDDWGNKTGRPMRITRMMGE